jgi:hypothetical protein
MRWLWRSSTLTILFGLLVVGAAIWVYESTTMPTRPVPLPVADGDQEIAWLNAATSASAWQRFVQGVEEVTGVKAGPETFPRLTTAVPEIAVPLPGGSGRLLFRWYKTTNEWNTDYWVQALVTGRPPPLAVIGGNTTEVATDQARLLQSATESLPEAQRPLLLLTTATADRVQLPEAVGGERAGQPGTPLVDIYPKRTFRFCFSNHQMGRSVINFIWGRPELRPGVSPVYPIRWQDDPYSGDLVNGFLSALDPFLTALERFHARTKALAAASTWGTVGGFASLPHLPPLGVAGDQGLCRECLLPRPANPIPWSVGTFDRPNRYEVEAAFEVLDDLDRQPFRSHPLLLLCGQSQPSRRFVRALCRLSPLQVRQFVAAAGDTISFNTVYRDRNVAWPIQDLPCTLVFFCHHNPIADPRFKEGDRSVSGTEDLLLYKDIAAALYRAGQSPEGPCADASQLRDRLLRLRVVDRLPAFGAEGPFLFDSEGNRRDGTGEHVVLLQPDFAGERVLPRATITVHAWEAGKKAWVARCAPLNVLFTGARRR